MKILSILVFIFGFLQCGSLKLEEKHPFKIQSAISTEWSGAQLGSRGMDVKIIYSSDKNIEFDSIYFSKRMVKIESYIIKGQKMIVGHFNISTLKWDLILDANLIKEINNKIPYFKRYPLKLK